MINGLMLFQMFKSFSSLLFIKTPDNMMESVNVPVDIGPFKGPGCNIGVHTSDL